MRTSIRWNNLTWQMLYTDGALLITMRYIMQIIVLSNLTGSHLSPQM